MKSRTFLLTAICVAVTLTSGAQRRADQQRLDDPNSFSMILMGDPQIYARYDINQAIFDLTTAWAADNIDSLKIKAVLVTGDIVDRNDLLVAGADRASQNSKQMWEAQSHAFKRLDNKIPYIISTGNHDYGYKSAENGNSHFGEYFPLERNSKWNDVLVDVFPNRMGNVTLENAAYEFSDDNWGKILVIATEFAPRDEVLNWAKKLCESDKYKNHRVILLTHCFLRGGGMNAPRITEQPYKITPHNWGQDIWDKLVNVTPNIRCVLCGHSGNNKELSKSVSYREDTNAAGIIIPQMMFNVQFLAGNGGEGWLRILEFKPDGKTVSVKTYSPLFGISNATKHLAHRTESFDQFDMILAK